MIDCRLWSNDAMDEQDRVDVAVHPVGIVAPGETQTLWTVQVMRGVAALMVVIGHAQSAAGTVIETAGGSFVRSTIIPWGAGVDLFFVISGFIMVHASRRLFGRPGARANFLRRRLTRIVPLYWLATTLFLMLLGAAALKGGDPLPAVGSILASYAFFPADSHGDGRLFPVFDLGWTLNYEMFFYALFALIVPLPRDRAMTAIGLLLLGIVMAGTIIPGPSAAWFWTRPILFDFALGLAVGALAIRGTILADPVRIVMAVAGISVLLLDPLHLFDGAAGVTVANDWPRVVAAGLPVTLVLAASILGPEPHLLRAVVPVTRIGDASYSLYLFHPVALIGMEKAAQKLPAVNSAPGWLLVCVTVAAAIVIALAVHHWIERPITVALARRLSARPRAAAPSFVTP